MNNANDPMQALANDQPRVCGPLAAVTVASGAPERMRRLLQGALALTPRQEYFEGEAAAALAAHWGLDSRGPLEVTTYTRPEVSQAVTIRVVSVDAAAPLARPGLDCRRVGALGFGVAVRGLHARHAIVEQYGFGSTAGVTIMAFPRADGSTYDVGETHWVGPDEFMVLGVDRADMQPIGPIDEALGIGGPNYSSAIVSDVAGTGAFLDGVLGLELRREFTFESEGPQGGMRLPAGTRVRFQQWFSPGASSGYLVIMQLLDHALPSPQALGLRSRGIGMWSFRAAEIEAVHARALRHGAKITSGPLRLLSVGQGATTSLMLQTPDGLPIEILG